jgi:ankyrin repeat protein
MSNFEEVKTTGRAIANAAMNGELATLQLLLGEQRGNPPINQFDADGMTPLIVSAASCYIASKHRECFKCLASHGADLNVQERNSGKNALMLLASDNITDCIEHIANIVDSLLDLDLQDKFGDTALIKAARKGHAETVECLIRSGASINLVDQDGYRSFRSCQRGTFGLCLSTCLQPQS